MLKLKPPQWTVFNSSARFRILVAGRRFGKTFLSLVELCRAAWSSGRLAWYVGPSYRQAKRIAWRPLLQMTRPYWAAPPNHTDLRVELISGGSICLRGADNYDSLRGDGLDFLILDEYASISPAAWPEVLRPALADRMGKALFIGTPRGHNHFFDLFQSAQGQSDWATFQYTTEEGGNVSAQELESATHDLDEKAYRQEFQAKFENLTGGQAYYAFDRQKNVEPLRFNPQLPLFWALDFNINPMCSVIGQREGNKVYILAELCLADSNTWSACEAFVNQLNQWRPSSTFVPQVRIYGDSSGNSRKTAASRTDWQLVKDFFSRYPAKCEFRIPNANPPVKDRVNCVNAMLRNQAGERRIRIAPGCVNLIKDLERVHWKSDAHGNLAPELDKADPQRTHLSDALGYMISYDFGMRGEVSYGAFLLQ